MLSPAVTWQRVPSLAVFHTTPMVLFGNVAGDGYLLERYARLIRRHTVRRATVPVTVSFHARAELSGLFPSARDRLRVVYHGVDQAHYSPGSQKTNPLSLHRIEPPYLLFISNRFVWKNCFRLVQAYHKLVDIAQVDYDLVLIGKARIASEEERIARYLAQHRLAERVHLVDYVEQAALPDVYRGARAYIFPSMRETFGLTVLEAMACGVPVACARWGPLPEVAGDAAYYFDPTSIDDLVTAMQTVACDEAARAELSQRGLAHARFYTWERTAETYRRLVLEIADQ
jgi:glycosyltransferase involved in cell wall biosynthesis